MDSGLKWIKLSCGMLDGRSFKKIRHAQIGGQSFRDKLSAVWIELLILAGQENQCGMLIEKERPMTIEDIACLLDRDEDEIKTCMSFYVNEYMIEIQNGIYCISNWTKFQNEDKLESYRAKNRERQARYREKRASMISETCSNIINNESNKVNNNENVTLRNVTRNDNNANSNVIITLPCSNNKKEDKEIKKEDREIKIEDIKNKEEDYFGEQQNFAGEIQHKESKKTKTKSFVTPTVDEVREYCTTSGIANVDPEYFVDYNEARGWVLSNKVPMKDWKAAVRTWSRNAVMKKGQTPQNVPKTEEKPKKQIMRYGVPVDENGLIDGRKIDIYN